MNLTRQAEKLVQQLKDEGKFNGLPLVCANCESEAQKLENSLLDKLSDEETKRYIEDYCIINILLDTDSHYFSDIDESSYFNIEFDRPQLKKDLEEYILKFIPDKSLFPDSICYQGGDMEFYDRNLKRKGFIDDV